MHGGSVGAVAERVAIACARTVVDENKDLFLGELSISYLSAAPHKVSHLNACSIMYIPFLIILKHCYAKYPAIERGIKRDKVV